MSEREKADQLASVPLFASIGRAELNHVAQLSTEHEVEDGEVLVEQGEETGGFFVITGGTAVVSRDGQQLAELQAGDVFGELALLLQAPRTATVTARGSVRVLRVDPGQFQAMLLEHPQVAVKLLAVLADRLRALEMRDG